MSYSTSTGIYTPATGATTAAAGQVIASATWNGIFNDLTTALTTIGKSDLIGINGGVISSFFTTTATGVNFAAAAGDIATFTMPVPSSLPGYQVVGMRISNAAASLSTVNVSLYTGAGASGATIISSTATTITTGAANNSNSAQIIVPLSGSVVAVKASILYLHVSVSNSGSSTADVVIEIRPWY